MITGMITLESFNEKAALGIQIPKAAFCFAVYLGG